MCTSGESLALLSSQSHQPNPDTQMESESRIEQDGEDSFNTPESSRYPIRNSRTDLTSQEAIPDWTIGSILGSHFWSDSSASGDWCYVKEVECCKTGPRKRCSACHIICHLGCLSKLRFICRPTYREADIRDYRDERSGQTVTHHWVHRRRQDSKCNQCGKSFQLKFFNSKEIVALQCSWCKVCYHNKAACFTHSLLTDSCTFGIHASVIVPPTWIIKMPQKNTFKSSVRRSSSLASTGNRLQLISLIRPSPSRPELLNVIHGSAQSDRCSPQSGAGDGQISPSLGPVNLKLAPLLPFVVKPNPSIAANLRPLLVFLNPKSGGNQGFNLLRKFQWLLNPRQVFDLSQGGPRMGLELFGRVPNLRILACGGDGTIGWIFSTIDELSLNPPPAVAVLPLGTGNDLARTLHWGSSYTDEPISKIILGVDEGRIVALDRWEVRHHIRQDAGTLNGAGDEDEISMTLSSTAHSVSDKLPLTVFNNYFSLGTDAATALEFHVSREANPEKFNSRLKNKMFYAGCGGKDLLKRSWRSLADYVTLNCDGVDMTPLIRDIRPHVLLFLNIPRYGGGTLPWGTPPSNAGFETQRIDDGFLEVIGLSSTSLATLQVGGHGDRICQCKSVVLTTNRIIPMQLDGEPCRLLPSIIKISCLHQALVVQKPKRQTLSALQLTDKYSAVNSSRLNLCACVGGREVD